MKNWKKIELIFELLIFGIILGVMEDIIVVKILTDEPITWHAIYIIILIAIPFAIIGEVIIDKVDFIKIFQRAFRKKIE